MAKTKKIAAELGVRPGNLATIFGCYAKFKTGSGGRKGESLYEAACRALDIDGKIRPSGIPWKEWVHHHAEFIIETMSKAPKEDILSKKQRKIQKNIELSMPSCGAQAGNNNASFKRKNCSAKLKASQGVVCVAGTNVVSDEFLSTYEWRRVRMVALKKYGPVCQCCGASPQTGAVMNVDHIKPRRLFPQLALDVDNLQILCGPCNHGKGNWDMTDWRDPGPSLALDADALRHLRSIQSEAA